MDSYVKTNWQDRIVNPEGQIIQQGTLFNSERANKIEDGIYNVTENLLAHQADNATQSKAENEVAPLGAELVDGAGWTSDGWIGDFVTGFTHTAGNTNSLSRALPATGTNMYLVELTVESPTKSTAFTVSIGNSAPFVMYEGDYVTHTYQRGIKSVSDGNLVITPESAFDGKITGISVKQVTGTTNPTQKIKDSAGVNTFEIRPTNNSLANFFIGIDTGRYNISGHENVAIGVNVMRESVSGFWNSVIGKDALRDNVSGSRNCAVGYLALAENISGHRNVAIGSFALTRNTHGINNIALGADCLWYNTTGNYNIGLGLAALSENTVGNYNIAVGIAALSKNADGLDNIAIGEYSLTLNETGDNNIGIGKNSLYHNTSNYNIGIGYESMYQTTTGNKNVGIGYWALRNNTTGVNNIAIGQQALYNGVNENYSIAIGGSALYSSNGGLTNIGIGENAAYGNTSGYENIAIGHNSIQRNTTGRENVAIGAGAGQGGAAAGVITRNVLLGYNAGTVLTTGGNNNTLIGALAGSNLTTGAGNIIIGYNALAPAADSSNQMNIGNVITGDLTSKNIHLEGGLNLSHVPAADPHVAGQVWNNAGTLAISAG